MNIILVSRRHGRSRTISLTTLAFLIGLLLAGFVALGFYLAQLTGTDVDDASIINPHAVNQWRQRIDTQEDQLARTREYTEEQIRALTVRLAELQARLTRLDALGERLVDVAELDGGEFDFAAPPAVGGPEIDTGDYTPPDFVTALDQLSDLIGDREQQLTVLNSLLGDRKIQSATFIAGRPIKRGWMSSRYGYRNDPFTGKVAWHDGLDFAGKSGSDIVAVASGVVTWAGDRYGYGNLVEINHGNGYSTRYGHAKKVLVNVGDVVKKGDVIALMGSTGRSTGPHVHFEVLKRGKSMDPAKFINRVAQF